MMIFNFIILLYTEGKFEQRCNGIATRQVISVDKTDSFSFLQFSIFDHYNSIYCNCDTLPAQTS